MDRAGIHWILSGFIALCPYWGDLFGLSSNVFNSIKGTILVNEVELGVSITDNAFIVTRVLHPHFLYGLLGDQKLGKIFPMDSQTKL